MELVSLLIDSQIDELDKARKSLCKQRDSIAKKRKTVPKNATRSHSNCDAELAVYTAALINAAQKQLEYQAAIQVAGAAQQAYYQCVSV